jgi:hypothetical protein
LVGEIGTIRAASNAMARTRLAVAMGGFGFAAVLVITGIGLGKFTIPGGDITDIYLRAGDLLRTGQSPYFGDRLTASFFYAPPWAVAFAALSLLPPVVVHVLVIVADVVALRTMARTWLGVGFLCWMPLVPFELFSGNINLVVAAAIVAASRGTGWPLGLMTLAKLSPILGVDRRTSRSAFVAMLIAALVTLPWLWLWPTWIQHGLDAVGSGIGPQLPIPLWARLGLAAGLLLVRRPWARALAVVVAIPGFYYGTLVMLIAPIVVLADEIGIPSVRSLAGVRHPRAAKNG